MPIFIALEEFDLLCDYQIWIRKDMRASSDVCSGVVTMRLCKHSTIKDKYMRGMPGLVGTTFAYFFVMVR
jgi:hypothetical protein